MALRDLREMGFTCDKVEQTLPKCFITKDFIGCVDVIAFRSGFGILGVQVTGGGNHSHRVEKSLAEPRLRKWIESGGRFEVWSYDKRGGSGERQIFKLRRQELRIEDFPPVVGDSLFQEVAS